MEPAMSDIPVILLRDAIAVDATSWFAKGMILPWPADQPLPPGMVWLREPDGDFTETAKQVMRDVVARERDRR
jgi:hypothetical protein